MVALICSMCGAKLELDENKPYVTCSFCDTQFLLKDLIGAQSITKENWSNPLLDRAFLLLEDGEFEEANNLFEQYLRTVNAKNPQIYIGKMLTELKLKDISLLRQYEQEIGENKNFQKALRFADPILAEQLRQCENLIKENKSKRITKEQLEKQKKEEQQAKKKSRNIYIAVIASLFCISYIIFYVGSNNSKKTKTNSNYTGNSTSTSAEIKKDSPKPTATPTAKPTPTPTPKAVNQSINDNGEFTFTVEEFYEAFELEEKTDFLSYNYDNFNMYKKGYAGTNVFCYTLPNSDLVSAIIIVCEEMPTSAIENAFKSAVNSTNEICGLKNTLNEFAEQISYTQLGVDEENKVSIENVRITFQKLKADGYEGGIVKYIPARGYLDIDKLPLEIDRKPDFFNPDYSTIDAISYFREFKFDEIVEAADSYIEEMNPSETDYVYIVKELAEEAAKLKPLLTIQYDEFSDTTYIYYKDVNKISNNINFLTYIEMPPNKKMNLTTEIGFVKSGWLFTDQISIKTSDGLCVNNHYKDDKVIREIVSGDTIMEKIVVTIMANLSLDSIVKSENLPVIRFSGENEKTYDHTFTQSEHDAVKTIYKLYWIESDLTHSKDRWEQGVYFDDLLYNRLTTITT